MDRRFHLRLSADLPVLLTQLDDGLQSAGRVEDISDSGICSILGVPIAPGAVVRLEILGLTLYGHVVYLSPADDLFRTGIFVEPALLDSSQITELVKDYLTIPARNS